MRFVKSAFRFIRSVFRFVARTTFALGRGIRALFRSARRRLPLIVVGIVTAAFATVAVRALFRNPPEWDEAAVMTEAVGAFAWPVAIVAVSLIFRRSIGALIDRIRRMKLFGNDIDLDALEQSVQTAEANKSLPAPIEQAEVPRARDVEAVAPIAALILSAADIERELRRLYEGFWHRRERYRPVRQVVHDLVAVGVLTREIANAVDEFWLVRGQVVHGQDVPEGAVRQAADLGGRIHELLRATTTDTFLVTDANIPLYEEPSGPIDDVFVGVEIQTRGSSGLENRVFPTRNTYQKGERVTWRWNPKSILTERYVQHEKGFTKVFDGSMEFVGELRPPQAFEDPNDVCN